MLVTPSEPKEGAGGERLVCAGEGGGWISCSAFVLLLVGYPARAARCVILIKLTSPGPVIYSQTRLGRHGRPFTIYKLRSMTHNCESLTGALWSTPGDCRVTAVGRWLRRTHIDELPQLWNVLCGEMSLIGPRPERPEFLPQLEQAIPCYRQRLEVRPGLTGFAQVQLPPDSDLESVRIKLAYDLYYLRHLGPLFELRIYVGTVWKLLGLSQETVRRLCFFPPPEKSPSPLSQRPRDVYPRGSPAE